MGTGGYCCVDIFNPQNPNSQIERRDSNSDKIHYSRIHVVYPSSSDNLLIKLPNPPKKAPPNPLTPDHSLNDSEF